MSAAEFEKAGRALRRDGRLLREASCQLTSHAAWLRDESVRLRARTRAVREFTRDQQSRIHAADPP